jgi:hypothetical protein
MNFRSLRDVRLTFGRQTALVGGNGAGKSSVLRAIELFYAPSLGYIRDFDFFDRTQPIEIELTFTNFTEWEQEQFRERISGGEMTVARVIELGGGKNNGRYFGMTSVHAGFSEIRAVSGTDQRTMFNAMPRDGIYGDLPAAKRIDQVEGLMADWENAHPDQCTLGRDNGQFLGFTNVGRGALQKATSFVLIPAVRDASADAQDGKSTAIGQLMELIVRSAIQSRRDIQDFQKQVSERFAALTDPSNLPELGGLADEISVTLGQLYANAAVALRWKPAEAFALPLPGADVGIKDEDLETPVDRTGHGLQRAFVIALLQHLARARAIEVHAEKEDDRGTEGGAAETQDRVGIPSLPGLILAIEEPELYQHPTKQRHFARVLRDLSTGVLPGMATNTQLMFATHSPYFISLDHFEEVRLLRRVRPEPDARRETIACSAGLDDVCRLLERAAGREPGSFTIDSLKPRLHIIDTELAEGFFADAVVLVEGPSDRAALMAAAALRQRSFEAEGIAILPVGGKDTFDRPWAIFRLLDIPVYALWDSDSSKTKKDAEKAIKSNRLLQRLLGSPEPHEDYPSVVASGFACFRDELETTLGEEIGVPLLNDLLERMVALYGLPKRDDALKNPGVMSAVLRDAHAQGAQSHTLAAIVDAIFALVEPRQVPPKPVPNP